MLFRWISSKRSGHKPCACSQAVAQPIDYLTDSKLGDEFDIVLHATTSEPQHILESLYFSNARSGSLMFRETDEVEMTSLPLVKISSSLSWSF